MNARRLQRPGSKTRAANHESPVTVHRPITICVNLRAFHPGEFRGCGRIVSPFVSIRGYYSRSGYVHELVDCTLDPDALFSLRIAIPENLLLPNENAVCAALRGPSANL